MIETGISTHAFAYHRLSAAIVGQIAASGFDSVELYMHKPHFDFEDTAVIEEILGAVDSNALRVNSIHCPFYRQIEEANRGRWLNITSPDEDLRHESVEWIKKSIRLGDKIEIGCAVIHFGDINDKNPGEEKAAAAVKSLVEIEALARPLGVKVVLENIPNIIATCARLNLFLEQYNLKGKIGICFDTGHAAMTGEIPSGIRLLGNNIKTVHLHDTREYKDEHLSAGEGILDWKMILAELKSAGYSGRLILENKWGESVESTIRLAEHSAKMLQKIWDEV